MDLFDKMLKEVFFSKEEAAKAIDMGNFYAFPADNRDLNYDKFFKEGGNKENYY